MSSEIHKKDWLSQNLLAVTPPSRADMVFLEQDILHKIQQKRDVFAMLHAFWHRKREASFKLTLDLRIVGLYFVF